MFNYKNAIQEIKNSNYNDRQNVSGFASNLIKESDFKETVETMNEIYAIAIQALEKKFWSDAALLLVFCHRVNHRQDEVAKLLFDNYYSQFVEIFKNNYDKNINEMRNNSNLSSKDYPEFSALRYSFMPMELNANSIIDGWLRYDSIDKKFEVIPPLKTPSKILPLKNPENYGKTFIIHETYDKNSILEVQSETSQNVNGRIIRAQLYLYFDSFEEFISKLQIVDFTDILIGNKTALLFGESELKEYLMKPENFFVQCVYSTSQDAMIHLAQKLLPAILNEKNLALVKEYNEMNQYYSGLTPAAIREKIIDKTVRVALFPLCVHSGPVVNFLRDCIASMKCAKINSELFISNDEFSFMRGINQYEFIHFLNRFRPDIMITPNRFRWQFQNIPPQLVFFCWLQDSHAILFDRESVKKMTNLDFILGHFLYEAIVHVGYKLNRYIYFPVLSNQYVYKKYDLSNEEMNDYSTDVCIVANTGNSFESLKNNYSTINDYRIPPGKLKAIYDDIYKKIFDDVYFERKHYVAEPEVKKLFIEHFTKNCFPLDTSKYAHLFWEYIVSFIYKDVHLLWIHEKGYDMKIWGSVWHNHPILNKYAKGEIKSREMMSKVLNASKISINLGMTNFHPRVLEAILSNCLALTYDPPPADRQFCADMKSCLKPDEEFVLYENKNDLYRKIDYYLSNEEQRQKVIRKGKEKVLGTMTYEANAWKMLEELADKILEP